jgi:hypothetical protein
MSNSNNSIRCCAVMITALATSSEALTAETFHTEVFWVVAPCSLVYTSVAGEQVAFIFTVEVHSVSRQLNCYTRMHWTCSLLTPPISCLLHPDLEVGGTVFFVCKITRCHKQEGHNMHDDESVVTITSRRFQLGFRGTEVSRNSEVSESLWSVQPPVLCTQ